MGSAGRGRPRYRPNRERDREKSRLNRTLKSCIIDIPRVLADIQPLTQPYAPLS